MTALAEDFTRRNRESSLEGGTVQVPTYVELPKNNMILWLSVGFCTTLMIETMFLSSIVRGLAMTTEKMFGAWLAAGHPPLF